MTTEAQPAALAAASKPLTKEEVSKAEAQALMEAMSKEAATPKAPSIVDLAPESFVINKVELAPLSAAIFRIHEAIVFALYEKDKTVLDSEETGLLLLYLMRRGTKSKRMQLWVDARNPYKLFEDFVAWNFDDNLSDRVALLATLHDQIEDYHKAQEILGGSSDETEDCKKKVTPQGTGSHSL